MKKQILELSLDTESLLDGHILVRCNIDLPFSSKDQKSQFEKKAGELSIEAVAIIKAAAKTCNCEKCRTTREQHDGGACENVPKSRYRTY